MSTLMLPVGMTEDDLRDIVVGRLVSRVNEALVVLRKERDAARRERKCERSAALTTEIMFARDLVYRLTEQR